MAGITLIASDAGTVQGNRVRGLASDGAGMSIGIETFDGVRVTLRSNDVIGSGTGMGLSCDAGTDRAMDNVVNGFANPMVNCGDAGGNDLTPVP